MAPQNTFLENIVRRSNGKDEDLIRCIEVKGLNIKTKPSRALHWSQCDQANQLISEIEK